MNELSMNELSCATVRDLAAEAALDLLPGDERARVFEHLAQCAACQSLVDSYARAADALLVSLPPAHVPQDLALRLRSTAPTLLRRRRSLAKPLLSVAAVILVALTLVLVGLRATSSHHYNASAETGSLVSPSHTPIGSVKVDTGTDPWISMSVDSPALADGTYRCDALLTSNATVTLGHLTVSAGSGSWTGPLGVKPDSIKVIRVVAPDGHVVAAASLNRADVVES